MRRGPSDRSAIVVVLRLAVVAAGLVAEVWNLVDVVRDGTSITEHLGYFTVQSNLLVLVVVSWMVLRPGIRPAWFDGLRGAATAYIVLTGIIWMLLLASPAELGGAIAYPSFAQHRLIPLLMAIDWLLVPTRAPLRIGRSIVRWMLYPLLYLAVTWIRGAVGDGWIPYPFLDPAVHGGPVGLVVPTGQVLLGFVGGTALVAVVGRGRHRVAAPSAP